MIVKWDYGFPAACDSACIFSGVSRLSFPASDKRSPSLIDLGKTVNAAPPVTVVESDGVMALIVVVGLN